MNRSITRGLLVACVAALAFGVPTSGSACECLDRLMPWNWCRGTGSSTTYASPFDPAATAAPAFVPTSTSSCGSCATGSCTTSCSPCATQTCCYVPQTSYRTVYRMTPVTTCQAVCGCDPCTGCPVTAYRPVTSYQRCAQLIPYTTYRMVWSNPCATSYSPCATSCGSGCSTSYYGTSVQPIGSSCCGTGSSATQSTFVAPPDSSPAAGETTAPRKHTQEKVIIDPEVKPIPEPDIMQKTIQKPKLFDPADQVTQRPIRQVHYVSDSRSARPATTARETVDFGGWRASRD
ncbi:MAG: hypothetical protein JW888_06440 [Pirellulales bacterium]|nr:hypothetical protein [Pirellulales bacterium]